MPGGGELVVGARHGVEDRAGGVAAEMARPARGRAGHAQVGLVGHELVQAGGRGGRVLADHGDGRLDFRHDAHVPQQLFRAAEILAHRIEKRQPALHVGVDVRLAVLDFGRVDQPAVDPIAQHGLHVVRIGLDAETGRRVLRPIAGRGHLGRLDEPHPRGPVGGGEQPQKTLAVAVLAADDFLLPLVPAVQADELVQNGLHLAHQRLGVGLAAGGGGPIGVSAADDVADAVLVAVDGELVGHGQRAALVADLGQFLLVAERHAGVAPPAGPPTSRFHAVPSTS